MVLPVLRKSSPVRNGPLLHPRGLSDLVSTEVRTHSYSNSRGSYKRNVLTVLFPSVVSFTSSFFFPVLLALVPSNPTDPHGM